MCLCSPLDAEYIGELIPVDSDKREYGHHHIHFPFIRLNRRAMASCLQNVAKTCPLELQLYTQSQLSYRQRARRE
jgi:hypothetical protein